MGDWAVQPLESILKFGNGKKRPEAVGDIPVYGGNGILSNSDKSNYDGETIVIGRVGAYCGSVFYEERPIWVSDNALSAKAKQGNDTKFLYYFLKNVELNQYAGGSSHPLVTQRLLNSLEFNVCTNPLQQKAIASVLSSLDDKIDLLQRQNKTLEAMAETLFRQWFVEEAEEDWPRVSVGDFVETNELSIGKDFLISPIRYLDTSSLTEGIIAGYQELEIETAPSRARRIVRHNDVIISTVRPNQKHYGILKHPDENVIVSTGFCVLSCDEIDPHFIYLLLTTDEMTEYLHSIAEGSTSTYPSLKPVDIEKIEFQLPSAERLIKFSEYAESTWTKIDTNQSQVDTLTKLRDTLLPKLMSGKVRVRME